MKKVLQIVGGLNRGGLETLVMNVYRNIDRSEIQFDFLIWNNCYDYVPEIESLGGKVIKIRNRRDGFNLFKKDLETFFKEYANEYIAVHYHAPNLSIIEPLIYAKKYGIKKRIIHSHSSGISGSKIHYLIHYFNKTRVAKLATVFLGCSEKSLKWMYGGTKCLERAQMVNNGIDTSLFHYNKSVGEEVRKEFRIQHDEIVIGHIGRFCQVKNHAYLVNIFNEYHKVNNKSKLMMVGEGLLIDEIKTKVSSLGLDSSVIFTGLRTDIPRMLYAMDVFVLPSFIEGLPLTLVEAQTSGLPVICSVAVSKDAALTDKIKYISIKEDTKVWSDAITNILNSYERKEQSSVIKKAGFDIVETVEKLKQLYFA